MNIEKELIQLKDEEYVSFQKKIIKTQYPILGVRLPALRKFSKTVDSKDQELFLNELPHTYYDEYMLHSILLNQIKDMDQCISYLDSFLPYIDNWAVCDTIKPLVFSKHKEELMIKIKEWIQSDHEFTVRFGILMLMKFFLDSSFDQEQFEMVISIKKEDYYIKMMIAWYFSESLIKQWNSAIQVLKEERLDVWTHNKTIQKAIESYRISKEQKEELRKLRRKK